MDRNAQIIFMDNPTSDDPPIVSQTIPAKLPATRKEKIVWTIRNGYPSWHIPPVSKLTCPFDCESVRLRGKDSSLPISAPGNGNCKITASVYPDAANGPYPYYVEYDDCGTVWTTEDPEIDISDNPFGPRPRKAKRSKTKAKRAQSAKRKTARRKK